jgi:hypothetical protein
MSKPNTKNSEVTPTAPASGAAARTSLRARSIDESESGGKGIDPIAVAPPEATFGLGTASSTPHTEAVTPERRCRDNKSASAVENSVGSNKAATILGLGRLASLSTEIENPRMANEVGMTQRLVISSSRLRMQDMGSQLGIVRQNRVKGIETGPQEWEWLTMSL